MPQAPSLAGRAAAAVALLIGFYLLAIGIVAGLIAIPWAEWHYAHRVDIRVGVACLGAAILILVSIVPRPDFFIPPGPLLEEKDHPRLFEAIREVSTKTGQAMPVEVYLDPDLNAYVTQRGGIMGLGSRRVMGLGLPLLQLLSVTQMQAVLAHEFGHFHGGDTALGPWIYKTRAALGRTIRSLVDSKSVLARVFDWYAGAFIRITHAISRQQEFAADALAANITGAMPLINGLKLIHGGSPTFYAYWRNEVEPIVNQGYAPPYGSGFQQLMTLPHMRQQVAATIEEELRGGMVNPHDTHPPLAERIRVLEGFPLGAAPAEEQLAVSWLNDVDKLEQELLAMLAALAGKELAPISWSDAAEKVWVRNWFGLLGENQHRLEGVTPARLATLSQDLTGLAVALRFAPTPDHIMQEHRDAAVNISGAALGLALRSRGWAVTSNPGEEILLVNQGTRLSPFGVIRDLGNGVLPAEEWERLARGAGIWEMDLARLKDAG